LTNKQDGYFVHSLAKGVNILSAFDYNKKELSVLEISKITGIHRTTVHRSIFTLEKEGFIEKNESTGRYRLGLKLFELGNMVAANMDIRHRARAHIEKLAGSCGIATHLVIMDDWEAIYIDKIESPKSMIRYSRVGKRVPLHCTAVGKILLGGVPDEEIIKALSKSEFNKLTPNTIDNLYELLQQVQHARDMGYALDLEELELGLNCVAVPVYNYRGNVIAAISASGSASQFPAEIIKSMIGPVQEAGKAISKGMGWLPEK